jgi:hypothetical protein
MGFFSFDRSGCLGFEGASSTTGFEVVASKLGAQPN